MKNGTKTSSQFISHQSFDVIIIGAGLAGCALAHYLSTHHLKVLVLEAETICSGSSAACAGRAQVIEAEDDRYLQLVREGFLLLSSLGYELGIDLDWHSPGHMTLISTHEQWLSYQVRTEQLVRLGFTAEMVGVDQLAIYEPDLEIGSCLGASFSQEGHLNPFKLVFGFVNAARRAGVVFKTYSPVTGFKHHNQRVHSVICGNEEYTADIVVLAAGAWSGKLAKSLGIYLPLDFTCAQAVISEPIPRMIFHHIGFPGFYDVVHEHQRSISLGIGQHSSGHVLISNAIQSPTGNDCIPGAWGVAALMQQATRFFPKFRQLRILRSWAAPSPFLIDQHPLVGWSAAFQNVVFATGFHLAVPTIPEICRNLAYSIFSNQKGQLPPIFSRFSPDRFSTMAVRSWDES